MKLVTDRLTIIPGDHDLVGKLSPGDYEIHGFIKNYLANLKEDDSLLGWGVWFVTEMASGKIIGDIGFKGKPADKTVGMASIRQHREEDMQQKRLKES